MEPQRPGAVVLAVWSVIAVLGLSGLTALCTFVFKDELVSSWAAGRSDAGSVEPPAFVPVAVTMFVVVALFVLVLLALFREGHNWARILLSVVVALLAVSTLAGFRVNPPTLFVVLSVVSVVVDLVALALLWHPDVRAFVAGAPAASDTHA